MTHSNNTLTIRGGLIQEIKTRDLDAVMYSRKDDRASVRSYAARVPDTTLSYASLASVPSLLSLSLSSFFVVIFILSLFYHILLWDVFE